MTTALELAPPPNHRHTLLDGNGKQKDIEISLLSFSNNAIQIGQTLSVALSTIGMPAGGPDNAVVATGNQGFGVAWEHGTEVRFRWIGCQ